MSNRDAATATRRFGLGARPGDLRRIAGDPRGYVLAALAKPDAALIAAPHLMSASANLSAFQDAQFADRIAREMAQQAAAPKAGAPSEPQAPAVQPNAAPPPSGLGAPRPAAAAAASPPPTPGEVRRDVFQEEATARITRAASSDEPYLERLVMFWSNHFAISALKSGAVRVMAGAFEREAVRPHVLGRFADMLKAVEQHPAMLFYLDNAQSIGPNSQAGRNRNRGLNENLAREILELHTLGVDGGYTQADVTSFAKIITGWTVTDQRMVSGQQAKAKGRAFEIEPGQFAFMPQRHEPGDQTVLGKRYADRGLATGEEVLGDLARHPSTARHIARKLAVHFVGEKPPQGLLDRLAKAFRDTDGNLGAVAKALASAPEAWSAPPRKVVPPYDFTIALMRAFDVRQRQVEALRIAAAIGQPLWQPQSPKGWPDDDDAWMGPSAIRERLRIAERVAREIDRNADPRIVAADLLGDALSEPTRQAIARAEAREQGFELIVMSPEFLRR